MATYDDHPFYSDEGQSIMQKIFGGIYRIDENDATQIATGDGAEMKKMVNHYMSNKVGIVFNIRKFLSSYTPVNPDNSYDSGIYICDPSQGGCGRRDFIYNWEFVDFGVYGNMKTWKGNVEFVKNQMSGQSGFLVMTRARCNPFVVCLDCGEQWATKQSSASVCIYCSKNNVKMGGCGKEVYAKHFVKEASISNLQAENQDMIEDPKKVAVIQSKGKSTVINGGKPFAYRLVYDGPAYDKQINSFSDACLYFPSLEVGYEVGKFKRPYGFECDTCGHERFFPPPTRQRPFGRSMSSDDIDTNWTDNSNRPQTGGIYLKIGKNGNGCTECSGNYLPMMGWVVGKPKCLGPTNEYAADYLLNGNIFQQQIHRATNALPSKYPISAMRHGFTMDPKIICTAHKGRRGLADCPPLWSQDYLSECLLCGNSRNGNWAGNQCQGTLQNNYICRNTGDKYNIVPPGRKLDECPECTTPIATNYETFLGIGGRPFLFPRKKLVISPKRDSGFLDPRAANPNGTPRDVTGTPIRGKPVWQIFLDSASGDDYRFGLELAGIHTSSMIPTNLSQIRTESPGGGSGLGEVCKYDPVMMPNGSTTSGGGIPTAPEKEGCCTLPNGTGMMTTENVCIALNGIYAGDDVTCAAAKLANPTGTGACAGVTFSGLTFMIAEGRAQHAYKDSRNRWVDDSVPCQSYRDPANPDTPLTAPITYARFMSGPNYDPRVIAGTMAQSRKYEWCDSNTHLICDPFHTGSLANITTGAGGDIGIALHDITQVGSFDDPSQGRVVMIKCKTCEQIYKRGLALATKNPTKRGTPYPSSDWTLINGGKDLQDAFENKIYFPGMGVLMFRSGKGMIRVTGWKDRNTPEVICRKPRQYSAAAFFAELKTEQESQAPAFSILPGYWNWMHTSLVVTNPNTGKQELADGSKKANAAKGNVIVL